MLMDQQEDSILRLRDVIEITRHSRSQIYALMRQGRFPRQTRHGRRGACWSRLAVMRYVSIILAGGEYSATGHSETDA